MFDNTTMTAIPNTDTSSLLSLAKHTMRSFLLVCSYLSFSCLFHASAHIFGQSGRHENPSQRSVTVQNESGRKVDIFWVNNLKPRVPETFVSQSEEDDGYSYGADAGIISYVGHTFEIRELPGKISGRCVEETCWKGRFVVNNEEDQSKQPAKIGRFLEM